MTLVIPVIGFVIISQLERLHQERPPGPVGPLEAAHTASGVLSVPHVLAGLCIETC